MGSHQINKHLTLEENMREIMAGCISFIREQVPVQDGINIHPSIHEIRRSVKRIRAILRLFRDEIGYSNYFRENRYFRDLSRRLSPVRDYFVLYQLVESLEKRFPDVITVDDFRTLKDHLTMRTEEERERFTVSPGGFEQVLATLALAEERMDQYCHVRNSFNSVGGGVKRVYKQGRRHLVKDRKQFNAEVLHEYRKSTKYLLFQMEIMQPLFPKLLNAYGATIEKHDQILGDICDLDRLNLFLRNRDPGLIPLCSGQKLLGKINDLRRNLVHKAFSSAHLIYAEKPGPFVRRLCVYWNQSFGFTQNILI